MQMKRDQQYHHVKGYDYGRRHGHTHTLVIHMLTRKHPFFALDLIFIPLYDPHLHLIAEIVPVIAELKFEVPTDQELVLFT